MSKSFKVGDLVTWRSQAAGSLMQKAGTVVEVVPAFKIPHDKNFGSSRNHESYIVEVVHAAKSTRKRKPDRYWPRVVNLRHGSGGKTLIEVFSDPHGSYSNIESTN